MLTIILPAYNEAKRIESAVERVAEFMLSNFSGFEIIIAEDGSTDGTDEIAKSLAKKYSFVTHLHSDERLGRGKALNNAIKKSKHEFIIYMDVDLSTDLSHITDIYEALKAGYDIAIGSRLMKSSDAKRPFTRDFPSRVYNFLVRALLKSRIQDHQCGFKGFRKSRVADVLDSISDNHWFWDTELLILAQRKGLKIKEIPVRWEHGGDSKVDVLKDSIYMLGNIFRMMRR